jgi:general secretion pathway protein I
MRKAGGFTLLEVLVALVIVALGLMAAFGQVNQSLTAASRLRDMTLAHWIAVDQVTQMRRLGQFPAIGSKSGEIEMARTRWVYRAKVTKTDFEDLRQVDVTVAFSDRPDNVVASVTGIIGKPQGQKAPAVTDWPALEPKN